MELVQHMTANDTDQLLSLARAGDSEAAEQLLTRFRPRLRRMIRIFLDPRLAARVDPSDILQSAMAIVVRRLPEYLNKPTIGFYGWLRQITRDELIHVHRQHVQAQCRSVRREERLEFHVTDTSAIQLADRLVGYDTSPSQKFDLKELHGKVKRAMAELSASDREILLMRCGEHLRMKEIAEILSISETAARSRFRRGIQKLSRLVGAE